MWRKCFLLTWLIYASAMLFSSSAMAAPLTMFGGMAQTPNLAAITAPNFSLPRFMPAELSRDLEKACLTLALYHEARGEIHDGQIAVAHTIMNRTRSRAYPASVCGVVWQNAHKRNRCQFSFACDGKSDVPRDEKTWQVLKSISALVFDAKNPILIGGGNRHHPGNISLSDVTHYHTVDVAPAWGRKIEKLGTIGRHIFYRSERVMARM